MSFFLNFFLHGSWVMILLVGESIFSLALILQLTKILFLTTHREGNFLFSEISRKVEWLSRMASLSTLTGLLGTVLGIYSSFKDMQFKGKVSLEVFSGGISTALITTIYGLVIAIISVFFYHIFFDKLEEIENSAEIYRNNEIE